MWIEAPRRDFFYYFLSIFLEVGIARRLPLVLPSSEATLQGVRLRYYYFQRQTKSTASAVLINTDDL